MEPQRWARGSRSLGDTLCRGCSGCWQALRLCFSAWMHAQRCAWAVLHVLPAMACTEGAQHPPCSPGATAALRARSCHLTPSRARPQCKLPRPSYLHEHRAWSSNQQGARRRQREWRWRQLQKVPCSFVRASLHSTELSGTISASKEPRKGLDLPRQRPPAKEGTHLNYRPRIHRVILHLRLPEEAPRPDSSATADPWPCLAVSSAGRAADTRNIDRNIV